MDRIIVEFKAEDGNGLVDYLDDVMEGEEVKFKIIKKETLNTKNE